MWCNVQPNYCYVTILPRSRDQVSTRARVGTIIWGDFVTICILWPLMTDRAAESSMESDRLEDGLILYVHIQKHFNHHDRWSSSRVGAAHIHGCVDMGSAWWHAAWHMRRETGTRSQINLDNVVQSKVCDSYTTPATDLLLTLFTPETFTAAANTQLASLSPLSHLIFAQLRWNSSQISRSWPGRC